MLQGDASMVAARIKNQDFNRKKTDEPMTVQAKCVCAVAHINSSR